jgi:tetratricopeptide (TPR) repeat protein
MPRTLKLLLLIAALAAPPRAAAAQDGSAETIQTLTQAVAGEKKKSPETWFRLGIEYNRAGDIEKARQAFRQALKLSPGFVNARAGLAYTFFAEKNFNEAEMEAYRATNHPDLPADFTADHVLAAIRLQRYREVALKALARAEQALAQNPDAPDWNRLKGEALIALSISEQKIPPDLAFPVPSPPGSPLPDTAEQRAARAETRKRFGEAADCIEKYLRLARPVKDGEYLRGQLEALRFYSQDQESLPPAERVYSSAEVSRRAVIRDKPEPPFTSKARDAGLVGMVRLRATLAADGKVKHVLVIMPLRYGLSEKSVKAAREIRFTPARVGDKPVNQYVILEYNFGIY